MSISVQIGHTGQRLSLDPSVTSTLDALRSWIASQAAIQPRNQILLTPQGKQVRTQTLLTESEIFVFDSSWLNGKHGSSPAGDALRDGHGDPFTAGDAPYTISNQTDLQAWLDLFRQRKSWATELLKGCSGQAKQAEHYQDEQAVIERSLGVAVASLQQHIKSAEKQYASFEAWSDESVQDQRAHTDNWEQNLGSLKSIPARGEFTRFITLKQQQTNLAGRQAQQGNHIDLQSFIDVTSVKQAARQAQSVVDDSTGKVTTLRESLDAATDSSDRLLQAVEQINSRSASEASTEQPKQLVEEIDLVVKKMGSDLEHVQALPKTSPSVSQASKMALLHTKNYLPALVEYCSEINDLVHKSREQRDSAADTALEHMRTLSSIESQLAALFSDMKDMDVPEDQHNAFATLSLVSRLPSVYGQLLIESVRRREWVAKMKRDSATLQEEVAAYQEEEDKRRKKWMRTVDDVVNADALQSRVLGIDLSLQNEGGSWPAVTREELDEYLNRLREVYGQGPVTEEIEQAIKDLDKPTRKQIKHARAFKHGSLHEAAFGDTSLLLRGDEQHKSLREANIRLEEDVRAQKSRVRKLEDLLHRQTQAGRTGLSDPFGQQGDSPLPSLRPTSPGGLTSQMTDPFPRRDSSGQRRRSSVVQGANAEDNKRLAKRIVDLEAELLSYKDQLSTRKNSDVETQKRVDEAISTKQDLMQNMEAQQREFADERRNLEKELAEAKEKIEETENEIERLMGSRDGVDEEITRLKEDAAGHAARAATEQDARTTIERKLAQAEAARANVEEDLQRERHEQEQIREGNAENLQLLAIAHAHLSPDEASPTGIPGLAVALEELARRSAGHVKDLEDAVAFAKSENESLWTSNERQKNELAEAAQKHIEAEQLVRQAEGNHAAEQAKVTSLEQQLGEEQEQLRLLRNKFADGETGSEVLQQRLTEEENKARKLAADLAAEKVHNNSLDVELMRMQKKHKAYHGTAQASEERLEKRAERAKELSQRLYSQNIRLTRLLERLGLVISYQDNSMVIERASKMNASTVTVADGQALNRTVSLSSPPPTRKSSTTEIEPSADLRLLRWVDAQSPEDEAIHFDAFLNVISRFDLDVFAEAVTKRVKDFEYTAKKYSKEAKESTKRADAYKERALKLRTEAHTKIAVRDFKEGDLALFLPTRGGQVKGAWAAFNIGCPHYFLAERDGMRLGTRDFIVARIHKVEQKVVDLSGQRTAHLSAIAADGRSFDERSDVPISPSTAADHDDNPFDLSDGLTWWMVHATEERGAGAAPTTPGLGKSTVAAANVDAKGSIRIKRSSKSDDASKHLNKSLDSRRSSTASKKGGVVTIAPSGTGGGSPAALSPNSFDPPRPRSGSQTSSLRPLPAPVIAVPSGKNAAPAAGLGIVEDQHPRDESVSAPPHPPQRQSEEIPSTSPHRPKTGDSLSPTRSAGKNRLRSKSPSKSVRSLQRHLLDPAGISSGSPVKASPAKKSGWESLWSAEFSVESPTKKG